MALDGVGSPRAIVEDGTGIAIGVTELTDQKVSPGIQLGSGSQDAFLIHSLDFYTLLLE